MKIVISAIVAAGIFLPALLQAQTTQTNLNDTFSDGSRTDQNLPDSAHWYQGATVNFISLVSGGQMITTRTNSTTSAGQLTAFFTASGSPQTLAPGSSITLSFHATIANTGTGANNFRFGLFNSGGSRISGDTTSANGTASAFTNWLGYSAWLPLGSTNTATFDEHKMEATNSTLYSSSINTALQTLPSGTLFLTPNTQMTGSLTLSNDAGNIVYSASIGAASFSGTDTSASTLSFDSVAFFWGSQVYTNILDDVQVVVTTSVPTGPATITVQPTNVIQGTGRDAAFTVIASGAPPISYQWYYGDTFTVIPDATNATLVLTNISLSQSNTSYFVIVSNSFGSDTSSPNATLTVVDLSSPTVGYWRFEPGNGIGHDYSTNGIDLNEFQLPEMYALPDTNTGGQGAYYSKSIPLTGATNINGMYIDGASGLMRSSWPSFAVSNQFAIEAYFNMSSILLNSVTMPIAGRWDNTTGKSWVFGTRSPSSTETTNAQIRFGGSADGVANSWVLSVTNWSLVPNHDYYAALVFNTGTLTVYFADLESSNAALQKAVYTNAMTGVYDPGNDFTVGYYGTQAFKGIIDELRLSRVALTAQELLIPTALPGVPAGLVAVPGDGQVSLSWTAVVDASGYNLKRSLTDGGPYTIVANVAGTNYVDAAVTNGTTYYYVVSATGVGGESADSVQAAATPAAAVVNPPEILPVTISGTNLLVSVTVENGHNYILQSTTGLEGIPVWINVATNTEVGVITNIVPMDPANPKLFLRYLVE